MCASRLSPVAANTHPRNAVATACLSSPAVYVSCHGHTTRIAGASYPGTCPSSGPSGSRSPLRGRPRRTSSPHHVGDTHRGRPRASLRAESHNGCPLHSCAWSVVVDLSMPQVLKPAKTPLPTFSSMFLFTLSCSIILFFSVITTII